MRDLDSRFGLWVAIALAVWSVFVLGRAASAQDAGPELCAPEITANRRAVLEHDGDAGIWFHVDVARCILGELAAAPEYRARVSLLEQRLELSVERDALQLRRVATAEEEAAAASGALESAERRAREAEESRDAWYRHPALWAAIGAVLVAIVGVGAIWALKSLSPP